MSDQRILELQQKLEDVERQRDNEAATAFSALRLLTDIRFALGDNGKRMQDELVAWCKEIAGAQSEAQRLRYLLGRDRLMRIAVDAGQERDALRARVAELEARNARLEREVHAWKSSHDNQVELKRILMDRPDLKERSQSMQALLAETNSLKTQVAELEHQRDELFARVTQLQNYIAAGAAWNSPDALLLKIANLESREASLDNIVKDCLEALPVGYVPAHTPESIPARIEDLVRKNAELEVIMDKIQDLVRSPMDASDAMDDLEEILKQYSQT